MCLPVGFPHAHLYRHGRRTARPAFLPRFCGRANTTPQVYVHGLVRQGRSNEIKQALMSQILEEIARIAGITAEDVWIYLQDIPATQMIEFGRFLPAPGDEAEWEREMTPEKRSRLPD